MGDFSIDQQTFFRRLNGIHSHWLTAKNRGSWSDTDAFCIAAGKSNDEDSLYRKSLVIQLYLLNGLEFPGTLMVMTKTQFFVLAGDRQISILEPVLGGNKTSEVQLNLLRRSKADADKANFETIIQAIKASHDGKKLGVLEKERPQGDFINRWNEALKGAELKLADISAGVGAALAIKDDSEIECIRKAAALSSKVLKSKLIPDMEDIIDEKKVVNHTKISEDVENVFEDPSKINVNVNPDLIESCYSPIIQSGGIYDLKPSAQSQDTPLSYDVILVSLGARYKNYCSNVGRTFFIDPLKCMEKTYDLLLRAQDRLIHELRPGSSIKNAVESVRELLRKENPTLVQHFVKSCGFGIGLEFRENGLMLTHKNAVVVREGMAFNVSVGFQDVATNEKEREAALKKAGKDKNQIPEKYSMLLTDTVIIGNNGADIITKGPRKWKDVSYFTEGSDDEEDEDEDDGKESKKKSDKPKGSIHGTIDTSLGRTRSAVTEMRLRDQQRQLDGKETAEVRRERHQQELMKRKREEAERRLKEQSSGSQETTQKVDIKTLTAYRSPEEYPREVGKTQILVDFDHEAVFFPINGMMVPFHIKTIKNVSKNDEEKGTYLRINFYTPAQSLGKDVAPVMAAMVGANETKIFIKELNYRSIFARNLNNQFRAIKELQKRVRQREAERQEQADLVVQEDLILTRDRRVPRLADLNMRPHISGRKTQGSIEAHNNGLRFTSIKGETVDILYSNIRHAIFQPCEMELVVLLHFHLKNHILIGKKKQKDVQFFTEVMEASQALDNRRRSTYDPDELDEEQRERQLRNRLNQTFKEFAKKVEACAERADRQIQFDIPYRELSFHGTPYKEMVLLQPSVNCLVNLTEMPFFLISLEQIEHVHFERVSFGSKNFDMAIITKDYSPAPPRISAISTKDLDSIKEWLDGIDITFTEGPATLNWKNILEKVKEEVEDGVFYLDHAPDGVPKPAGWNFLRVDGSDDESEEEEEEDSNYSEDEGDDDEDDSEEDDEEDESDWDSIVSEESEDDLDEEEEDDAPSWEELEREAAAADKVRKKREAEEDSEDDKRKAKAKKRKR